MNFGTDDVLVTGAAGWLGYSLMDALVNGMPEVPALAEPQTGLRIRALVRPGEDASALRKLSDRITIVEGDLTDARTASRFVEGAEGAVLFHTAGIIHPGKVSEFHAINVEGTRSLLEAAEAAKVKRAVVVSSNSPFGCNPRNDHRFDESSPYNPYMGYGRSKMQMEQVVKAVQARGALETVLIRAPWFYGPFQPPRQTLFFQMIRDGGAPIVGSGDNRRSMAYLGNLAQGLILAALTEKANGQAYWIADERPYPMNEIVDTVERLLETEFGQTCAHKRLRLPGLASDVARLVDGTLQAAGLYHQKIHVLSEMNQTIACDVSRAKQELGYTPTVALEEGMRRSLKWVFEHQGGM